MDISRRQFAIGSAALAGASALPFGAGLALAQAPLKVGFVYVGPISDHGYSYQHDLGRKEIEKVYGAKVQTSYVENVPEGADAERVINQLASQGHGLIFTTSFGFMNPTERVAKRFPKVRFEHATGYKRAENLATYSARFYEGRTVLGTIAGRMTKSNVIGYIGSFPIPEVVSGINAFTIALRKQNPNAQVRVVWVNSWYDPAKEADAAKALIDQGADVITQHTDSPAGLQIAEQRGVWCFGQSSDMSRFAPTKCLTSIVDDWAPYYVKRTQMVMDGTWKSTDTWEGMKEGMVVLPPFNPAMGPETMQLAEKVKQDIVAGRLHPFAGPVKDQQGKVVIAEGKSATDEDILKMSYYVEGVQGSLPK
jgi:simple sugar transport system substrate-binding protein